VVVLVVVVVVVVAVVEEAPAEATTMVEINNFILALGGSCGSSNVIGVDVVRLHCGNEQQVYGVPQHI